MTLQLKPATDADYAFCQHLSQQNMATYLARRGCEWEEQRFKASWESYENWLIVVANEAVGVLRFLPEGNALGLRDLQIVPAQQNQGHGTWAVEQAKGLAKARGYLALQLRVYEENPAQHLYARLGFDTQLSNNGTRHMVCRI